MRRLPMATIVIVTSSFPFPGGEQFLESEMEFWDGSRDRVILLPAIAAGVPRSVPAGIEVNLTLARVRTKLNKASYLIATLGSKILLNEIFYLRSVGKLNLNLLYQAMLTTSQALLVAHGLHKVSTACGGIDLVYTYWNDTEAIGAAIAKRRGHVRHVVSRAHGYDVFEDIRVGAYMPLKRQFIDDFDFLYPVSKFGHEYLADVFGVPPERNVVCRLGVDIPDGRTQPSEHGRCHIVSIAFCEDVKRIDKTIHALAAAAGLRPDISFVWIHVGGGPLLGRLEALAEAVLSPLINVEYVFTGNMSHDEVRDFLLGQPIDMFINTSESEGIPVSIMEAMSCGIPAIAPDVGGMPEIVGNGRGVLMSTVPDVAEIAAQLTGFLSGAKRPENRQEVREFISREFNAGENYRSFVERCIHVVRPPDGVTGPGDAPVTGGPGNPE
jgi:glycosyltransferase involved in cell wall biosynthesis